MFKYMENVWCLHELRDEVVFINNDIFIVLFFFFFLDPFNYSTLSLLHVLTRINF